MTFPAPNLDDRRFQDLVDDAKRHVQQRCPQWSDHNVSDPGVTLIETFAMMTDQLLYRLNRVPDRLYLRFLDLIGLQLRPPAAAAAPVTFWLSAPQPDTVTVPAGTEVATARTGTEDAVAFGTVEALSMPPCTVAAAATSAAARPGEPVDRTEQVELGEQFACFSEQPAPGDALLIGLSVAVPGCAVAVRFTYRDTDQGAGVDPRDPPLVWEAWTGQGWEACELERDGTGGLNRPGDVVAHVPAGHRTSVIARRQAGWLRCRVLAPRAGQPFFTRSPRIRRVEAFTVGGTVEAAHAETVREEVVGLSEGVPGQRLDLARGPVPAGEPPLVEVASGRGWEPWTPVAHFASSGPDDPHVVLDPVAAQIRFGPGIREPDGTVRRFGAVPPKAAPIRVSYRVGGGRRGNVARGEITALRASVPYVATVGNRRPATGGVDAEDVEGARARAPQFLRARERAVTAADHEYLAREADPRVGRVRCRSGEPGVVRLAVLPEIPGEPDAPIPPAAIAPSSDLLARVTGYLDERRILGTRLLVEPPSFTWVTAVATVRPAARADAARVRRAALGALYRHLHPLRGGRDGAGWPFGRPVPAGELLAAIAALPGVDVVEEVRLYPVDAASGRRAESWTSLLPLHAGALPYSFEHHVEMVAP